MGELINQLIQVNIESRISEIKTIDFKFTEAYQKLNETISENDYMFHTTTKFSINREDKAMHAEINMSVSKAKELVPLAKVVTSFKIIIENLDTFFTKDENGEKISNQIVYTLFLMLANVSIATTRGIFIAKLEDSKISNAYFPIYNPDKFVPQEIKDKLTPNDKD